MDELESACKAAGLTFIRTENPQPEYFGVVCSRDGVEVRHACVGPMDIEYAISEMTFWLREHSV